MKKLLLIAALVVSVSSVLCFAQDPDIAWRNALAPLASTNGTVYVAISDTNATTVATKYTPRFAGQILFGKTGGTATVWLATGATTNNWKQVNP